MSGLATNEIAGFVTITLLLALVLVLLLRRWTYISSDRPQNTRQAQKGRAFSANGVLTASATLAFDLWWIERQFDGAFFVLSNSPYGNLYGPCGGCDGSWFWPRRHHQLWFDLGRIRDELAWSCRPTEESALALLLAPKLRRLRQSQQQQSIWSFFSSLVHGTLGRSRLRFC